MLNPKELFTPEELRLSLQNIGPKPHKILPICQLLQGRPSAAFSAKLEASASVKLGLVHDAVKEHAGNDDKHESPTYKQPKLSIPNPHKPSISKKGRGRLRL